MVKYSAGDALDKPDRPPQWVERTSVGHSIDIQMHHEGYQNDRKWRVLIQHRPGDEHLPDHPVALGGVEYSNKGNFWRDGDYEDDWMPFSELPLVVRQRLAALFGRSIDDIAPDEELER